MLKAYQAIARFFFCTWTIFFSVEAGYVCGIHLKQSTDQCSSKVFELGPILPNLTKLEVLA